MSLVSEITRNLVNEQSTMQFPQSKPWLESLRADGIDAFKKDGLPDINIEKWKYTNLNQLNGVTGERSPEVAVNQDQITWLLDEVETNKLVFVNGYFKKSLSKIIDVGQGIRISALCNELLNSDFINNYIGKIASTADNPLFALNTAFIEDGCSIVVENCKLLKPIEVVYISTGSNATCHYPRNIIIARNNAEINIVERHIGFGGEVYMSNGATEILVEDHSKINHYRIFEDAVNGINLSSVRAVVKDYSCYNSFVLSTGGRLNRCEIDVSCAGDRANASLSGVYTARDQQHTDHTTRIEHLVPNTTSVENYRGALDGSARGVFQGSIFVAVGADGTDGRMSNKNLLLSSQAEVNAKPQLEIYADDVQCAHGCTTGELDDEALFYLRSRGITEPNARAILVEGFLNEAFSGIEEQTILDVFHEKIRDWMVI